MLASVLIVAAITCAGLSIAKVLRERRAKASVVCGAWHQLPEGGKAHVLFNFEEQKAIVLIAPSGGTENASTLHIRRDLDGRWLWRSTRDTLLQTRKRLADQVDQAVTTLEGLDRLDEMLKEFQSINRSLESPDPEWTLVPPGLAGVVESGYRRYKTLNP